MVCKIILAPNSPIFWKSYAEEGENGNSKALFFTSKPKKSERK